jgi:predicted Ser/Thr protein kinase
MQSQSKDQEVIDEVKKILIERVGVREPIKQLGKGTYGVVLLLNHNGKFVACKVINKNSNTFMGIPKERLKGEIANEIQTM